MAEGQRKIIDELRSLSEVDASIARILAERKRFENELEQARATHRAQVARHAERTKEAKELQTIALREDKYLKGEREKLIARRKSLSTMGDYKVQQAAEREIDATEKQLAKKEEETLTLLMKVEESENEVKALFEKVEASKEELHKLEAEASDLMANLAEREREKRGERQEIAGRIESSALQKYEAILKKYSTDPVVKIEGAMCSGCFVSLGPQVILKISKGASFEQCPGCHRILYIPEAK